MGFILRIAIVAVVATGIWIAKAFSETDTDADQPQTGALPVTKQQVHVYTEAIKKSATKTVNAITAIPKSQKTFDNTIGDWNRFGYSLIEPLGILTYVRESDMPNHFTAAEALEELVSYLGTLVTDNSKAFECLIGYCQEALTGQQQLTPFDSYQIEAILDSVDLNSDDISDTDKQKVMTLKRLNAPHEKTPFAFWRGNVEPISHQDKPLTVMTLNTCGVPGDLTLPNGGMVPWPQRLPALAQKVLEANPDIVCLNEVYGYDAPKEYYERLKDHYAYFYTNIGPRTFGLSMATLGLASGLFVASKYPLEAPHFMRYEKRGYPVNDGLFDFVVMINNHPIAHIYTTHLQPDHTEEFGKIRAEQLQEAVDKIHADYAKEPHLNIPYFFGGDLNIPWGSGEPGLAIIQHDFYDAYNKGRQSAQTGPTWTDFFTERYYQQQRIPLHVDPTPGIIDYALLTKLPTAGHWSIHTTLVPIFNLQQPDQSLSDHNGLITTIEPLLEQPALQR